MKYTLLAITLILLLPDLTQAQGLTEGLCDGTTCSACHLAELGNRLINWLIGMVILLFAVLAVWAGFGLVTSGGNPSALEDAKKRFTNAFIGFLIVLSAWLLVDTLMRGIVNGTDGSIEGYGPWSQVQCFDQSEATTVAGTLEIEVDEWEGSGDSFGVGTYGSSTSAALGTIGTGNAAIVNCAQVFDSRQCLYSQANRNGCTGSPGYTDCSDLVNVCFRAAGCSSPGGTTAAQYPRASAIGSPSTLVAGDSIVYRYSCSTGTCGHVVICMNAGCSQVIHAAGRGAPDGQPATIAPANQITISNGSQYLNRAGARVIRTGDYCN